MVSTELAPRRQELHVYTTSVDINNTRYKRQQSLTQNHMRHVRCESGVHRTCAETAASNNHLGGYLNILKYIYKLRQQSLILVSVGFPGKPLVYTELTARQQQFQVAPAKQQPLRWIFKYLNKI